jgi:uncharacterized membrane-anchored protein
MQTASNSQSNNAMAMVKRILRKVPEITIYFWIIKVLCTTVGETAADFLDINFNLGLTNLTYIMGGLLAIVLFLQFRSRKYIPWIYWLSVVLISIFGTLITDNLTDNFGVSLVTTTIIFGVALIISFAWWYKAEKTLSIHSIYTRKREAFYWLAILFTFALGTASGDLIAERFNVGYLNSAILFAGVIAVIAIIHYVIKGVLSVEHKMQSQNAVLAFWLVYILTRPLGASIGDYLSQIRDDGGLGLGTTITSFVFLGAILITVIYLTITKKDTVRKEIISQT